MNTSADEAIADHLESTLNLAEKILSSVDDDTDAAFIKAVGILAQVMFITVAEEERERMIEIATGKLRDYLRLLDEVSRRGLSVMN
jgi:hypothetical protein